ncbi:hypothetical protein EXIGLDRAFT_772568 [Exidia glandulosa HHB12029]|uniref:Uncharacterized protein n=1 Tax=Exidia glandulosa HHB12029 TaxID=1314781 RepID=A0A165F8W8_EXIGL|nr:hypothetical protein EXIGLDRAFT_772568 [Exidia glandulosa HHB12029]
MTVLWAPLLPPRVASLPKTLFSDALAHCRFSSTAKNCPPLKTHRSSRPMTTTYACSTALHVAVRVSSPCARSRSAALNHDMRRQGAIDPRVARGLVSLATPGPIPCVARALQDDSDTPDNPPSRQTTVNRERYFTTLTFGVCLTSQSSVEERSWFLTCCDAVPRRTALDLLHARFRDDGTRRVEVARREREQFDDVRFPRTRAVIQLSEE